MNLYHWAAASCLKQYGYGDIIVMAETADEARQIARGQMDPWLKKDRDYWWNADFSEVDEWSTSDYTRFKELLEQDLAEEPVVVEPAVVFIRGSE